MVAAALLATGISACGGGSSSGGSSSAAASGQTQTASTTASASFGPSAGEVVARVGSAAITKGQVSHWMATLAGGDYYELSDKHTVPEGLVSDPPRYGACVARLEAAAAASPVKLSEPTGVQLLTKCRQIYQALRAQATALLVVTAFVFGLGSDEGITVSDAEVLAAYNKGNAERYSTPAQLASYQAARRASVSDELLLTKKNLISEKILAKLKTQGLGPADIGRAEASWRQKTNCRPGYVVEHCKQYHGAPPPSPDSPPASVLMEQVAALATGRCINKPACGKQ